VQRITRCYCHGLGRLVLGSAFVGFMTMWTARKIIAIVTGVIGVLLIARATLDGQLWPLSVQLVAGALLVVMAVLRWRTLV
jgi:uncharacterized membrane protein (Fun14 family)